MYIDMYVYSYVLYYVYVHVHVHEYLDEYVCVNYVYMYAAAEEKTLVGNLGAFRGSATGRTECATPVSLASSWATALEDPEVTKD